MKEETEVLNEMVGKKILMVEKESTYHGEILKIHLDGGKTVYIQSYGETDGYGDETNSSLSVGII